MLEHFDTILPILDDEANADVVYLDFAKAFDKVDHKIDLKKIKNLASDGQIYQWIESFLTNRYQSVVINGAMSEDPQTVVSGVPQGSVLGPLIFFILIGDIDEEVLESIVKSFADDTRATKAIKTLQDTSLLQNDLNAIYKWTDDNNMSLNDVKFEVLQYGKNQKNQLKNQTTYETPSGIIGPCRILHFIIL